MSSNEEEVNEQQHKKRTPRQRIVCDNLLFSGKNVHYCQWFVCMASPPFALNHVAEKFRNGFSKQKITGSEPESVSFSCHLI